MLAPGAAEGDAEAGESPLEVPVHGGIHQGIHMFEEGEDFPVVLQEADDRLVQSRQKLVGLIPAGVMDGTAVEDELPDGSSGMPLG